MSLRPPLEGSCEMSVGVDDRPPGIRVLLCRRPGVERLDAPAVVGHPIMCDEHYEQWKGRQR